MAIPADYLENKPNLVVLLVIDQFRADYLTRFVKRYLPPSSSRGEVGGFRYLMTRGAYFPYGQYENLQDMTCPGHATIATGAYPYQAGLPTNDWFDRTTGKRVYCAEDASVKTVGVETKKEHLGTSPRNLRASTFGDELKNAGHSSKVVSIALKDRSAIMMGGHRADLALWIDQESMRWVSSEFYIKSKKLPDWVEAQNKGIAAQRGKTWMWKAEGKGSGLSTEQSFGKTTKLTFDAFGAKFPHQVALGETPALVSPVGITMTVDAAKAAIKAEKLGTRGTPDVLAVSFSSHDYVGHAFGPNSREMEEMSVAEDQALADLFNFIKKNVPGGLDRVVIALTADHGIPPHPDYLAEAKLPAGRIDNATLEEALENHLGQRFGKPSSGKWVQYEADLGFYLNQAAADAAKLDFAEIQASAKQFLLVKEPGLSTVMTAAEQARYPTPGLLGLQYARSYVTGRSADVIAIPRPYFVMTGNAVDHYTGYAYDRTVPIIIAGPYVASDVHATPAAVVDIAPTLTFLLGVMPPNVSEGRVLSEIFVKKK